MLLVIDIGNTNIVLGVFKKEKLLCDFRLQTYPYRCADDYGILIINLLTYENISKKNIKAIIISSVVPPLISPIVSMCKKYFGISPIVVDKNNVKMKIDYENPDEVGSDRIVNALAGYSIYGGPLIIVDFGTATTFDVVSKDGVYLGGAIAPGVGISVEALFQKAAKLPRIELKKPKRVIGKNTVESMQSGIIFGYVEQIDGMIKRIKKELSKETFVLATGGLAPIIAPLSDTIKEINLNLTLEGLKIVYQKIKSKIA